MARGSNTSALLYQTVTSTGNVSTGETTLASYVLPANSLHAGYAVRLTAWGNATSNGDVMSVVLYFGSTSVTFTALATTTADDFTVSGLIVAVNASSQVGVGQLIGGTTNVSTKKMTPAEANTSAITIKITGTGGASNEIVIKGLIVELIPG